MAITTDTAHARERKTAGSAVPSLAVNVQLMQDYRMVDPAVISQTFVAVPTSSGDAEVYTLDGHGGVARLWPDPASDTGWSVQNLNCPAGQPVLGVAAYLNPDQTTTVWAATSTSVLTGANSTSGWIWGAPYDFPANATFVSMRSAPPGLVSFPIAVAWCLSLRDGASTTMQLYGCASDAPPAAIGPAMSAFIDWSLGPVQLQGAAGPVAGVMASMWGALTAGNATVGGFALTDTTAISPPSLAGSYGAIATAPGPGGALETCGIFTGYGNSYGQYLLLNSEGSSFDPFAIVLDPDDNAPFSVSLVDAASDGSGAMHILAVTTDGQLMHQVGLTGLAAPLITDTRGYSALAATTDTGGNVHFFAQIASAGQVMHGEYDCGTGRWTIALVEIDVPHSDFVEQIATYAATITCYADGPQGACGSAVMVEVTEPVTLELDGSLVSLDAGSSWQSIIGPDNQVHAVYQTDTIAAPMLHVWVDGMPTGDRVQVDLSAAVRATIAQVPADDGTYLLALPSAASTKTVYTAGSLLTGVSPADANSAAAAIAATMALADTAKVTTRAADPARLHPASQPHVAHYVPDWDGTPGDIADPDSIPDLHFLVDMTGDGLAYRQLDAAGAAAARKAAIDAGIGWGNVNWGDVFAAVADGAATVSQYVVTAITGGFQLTVTTLVNGVTYVWDAAVQGIKELMDLVQTVFAKLSADFWQLLGWLGWVFNWNDIVLTHQALSYCANNGIACAKFGIGQIQGQLDNAIAGVQAQLTASVAAFLASEVPSGATVGSLVSGSPAPLPGVSVTADPRDVFRRGFRVNADQATISPSSYQPPAPVMQANTSLLSQMQGYGTAAQQAGQGQALATLASPTTLNPAGLFSQPAADCVQAVADVASYGLGLVQDGADELFGFALAGIDSLQDVLTQTWDIPLVTDIYRWVTGGSSLSALDVICLLVAIPVTLAYKAIYQVTPIPDQATLQAVQAAFPAPALTASSPAPAPLAALAGDDAGDDQAAVIPGATIVAQLGAVLNGVCYVAYGFLEARVDVSTALYTRSEAQPQEPLPRCPWAWEGSLIFNEAGAAWVGGVVLAEFLTSVGGFMVTVAPNIDTWSCSQPAGMANILWAINNLELSCDVAALFSSGSLIRQLWGGIGPLSITVWGAVQIILQAIMWARVGKKGWIGSVAALLTYIPEACKILMSPEATWSDEGIPLPALFEGCIDIAGDVAGGIFWCVPGASGQ